MSTHHTPEPKRAGVPALPSQTEINAAAFVTLAASSLQSLAYQAAQKRGNPLQGIEVETLDHFVIHNGRIVRPVVVHLSTTEGAK